jgi:hypothetical protein
MARSFRYSLYIFVALAVLVVLPSAVAAEGANLSHQQLISQQCDQLHSSIDALRKRDLVSRLNRSRDYESAAKQLDAFNQRLKNNHYDISQFEQIRLRYGNLVDQFREAYNRSDDGLNALMQIDCKVKPANFDVKLQEARVLRQEVTAAVRLADDSLQQYRDAVVVVKTQLQEPNSVGDQQ